MLYGVYPMRERDATGQVVSAFPSGVKEIKELENLGISTKLDGTWYESITFENGYGEKLVTVTGYPHCCGVVIVSGLYSCRGTKKYLKGVIKAAKNWRYSQAQYITSESQIGVINALEDAGFVPLEPSTVANDRSGNLITTWVLDISKWKE